MCGLQSEQGWCGFSSVRPQGLYRGDQWDAFIFLTNIKWALTGARQFSIAETNKTKFLLSWSGHSWLIATWGLTAWHTTSAWAGPGREPMPLTSSVSPPICFFSPRYQDCVKTDFKTQRIIQYSYSLTLGGIMPSVKKSKFCWVQPSSICLENDKYTEIWENAVSEAKQVDVVRYMCILCAKHSKVNFRVRLMHNHEKTLRL